MPHAFEQRHSLTLQGMYGNQDGKLQGKIKGPRQDAHEIQ